MMTVVQFPTTRSSSPSTTSQTLSLLPLIDSLQPETHSAVVGFLVKLAAVEAANPGIARRVLRVADMIFRAHGYY